MSNTKVIYRDRFSNRLITAKEANTRDPETWVKEVFSQTMPTYANLAKEDLPSVTHLPRSKISG